MRPRLLRAPATVFAPCHECGTECRTFQRLVGTDAALCVPCAERVGAAIEAKKAERRGESPAWLKDRLVTSGLLQVESAVGLFQISTTNPTGTEPEVRANCATAWRAVQGYMASDAPKRPLFLCGPSGVGKTTAAAFAVWRGSGRFLGPLLWRSLPRLTLGRDAADIIACRGPVVLDNALESDGAKPRDPPAHVEVLAEIVRARDEARLPTIITTQTPREALKANGTLVVALLRRAVEDGLDLMGKEDPAYRAGGVIDCTPKRKTIDNGDQR